MRPIDYFDTAADAHQCAAAVVDGDVCLSYGELRLHSLRLASALQRAQAGSGRVALLSPNDARVIVVTLGAMRAGAALVPLHPRDAAPKLLEFLARVDPEWVFYHSASAGDVASIRPALPGRVKWICLDARMNGDRSLDDLVAAGDTAPDDWGDAYGSPEHPVYIRQTSGTTGAAKIVVNDIGSYAATLGVLRQILHAGVRHPRCLVVAPLSHAAGVHAFAMLTLGATLMLTRDFDPAAVLKRIERDRVTHLWLPPTALYLLLNSALTRTHDYSSLKSVMLGASPVAPERLREAVAMFGPCIGVNYAQIEGGFLTWLDPADLAAAAAGDRPERLRSSGTSLCVSRLVIMSDDDRPLPIGATGEIAIRGRSVKSYLDPAATQDAQRNGWHHTGDLGYLDRDGYLYVVGRKKDTIITRGYKVSAPEVEDVLLELPQVHECAVVGVPDELRGETVTAVITLRDGQWLETAAALRHCRRRLGRLKSPRILECWAELPKSAVGKVDKRLVRERILVGRSG